MISRHRRYLRLQRAFDELRKLAARDLAQATAARDDLMAQRDAIQAALENLQGFGDVILVSAIRRMGALTSRIAEVEGAMSGHRQRAADCLLKSKRMAEAATRARREEEQLAARRELAELISLPQAERG